MGAGVHYWHKTHNYRIVFLRVSMSSVSNRHNVFIILFPQVGDKEIFVSEEEVGGSREALQELINKGETEVAVKHYKEEVRKLLGLPETVVSPELVETQSQQ